MIAHRPKYRNQNECLGIGLFCSLTREYKNAEVVIAASAFCSCRILL